MPMWLLDGIFTDHMVLQRDMPVKVYGTADPGKEVFVSFAGLSRSAKADKDGNWLVKLDAMKACTDAATMTVASKNTLTLEDILVGDEWVCSGRSNINFCPGSYGGPLYKGMKVESGKIRISFDHVGSGLMIANKAGGFKPLVREPQGKLQRFAIAGEDKKWFWADAVIDGKTVVVSSPDVPKPVAVRYAFETNPEGSKLYNEEGLPASPFCTDDWLMK